MYRQQSRFDLETNLVVHAKDLVARLLVWFLRGRNHGKSLLFNLGKVGEKN
jgi:hypothetical protein